MLAPMRRSRAVAGVYRSGSLAVGCLPKVSTSVTLLPSTQFNSQQVLCPRAQRDKTRTLLH
jgi:hypothetical protein